MPPPPPPGAAGFTTRYGLVRPREGRYLAGVCAAVGRATNTDPVLWRVLLAVLGFFGGIGILVYVAAWLIIPGEGDSASPVESMLGRGRSSMSPVTVIVLSILVAVSFGYIVTDAFRAVLLGAAILVGGALLLNRHPRGPEGGRGPGAVPAGPGAPTGQLVPPVHPGPVPPVGFPASDVHPAYAGPAVPAGPPPPHPYPPTTPLAGPGPVGATAPPVPGRPPGRPAPSVAVPPGPRIGGPGAGYPGKPVGGAPLPGGYRPPFAPHGPYANPRPPAGHRPPPPPRPPRRPRERSPLGAATFSLIFVALGAVAILDLVDGIDIGASGYFATALAVIGLGLLVGTWFGRARWLIALGLVTAAALGVATVTESYDRIRGVDGNVTWSPVSHDALADRYENNFGDAVLDLRAVDFTNQDSQITVAINFGKATVVVPPNVDVTTIADVNAGDASVFGTRTSDLDGPLQERTDLGADGPGGGKLRLYIHVNAGNLEVTR